MTLLERPPSALSAQQVDPLSWVTGPYVPLVFGFLSLGYGIVMGFVTYPEVHQPGAQFVAAALCGLACLTVHVATRPMRPPLGWAGAIVALLIGTGALLLSALGCIGGRISIEQWWAPIGFAFVVASLAPYLPARRILGLGGVAAAVAVPVAYVAV
ncbi:hypothetical protein, partial [Mesorhizobium japonicum]|uniref:hypothetical protein n=1 Tax=Mesorhizobium japonicum TaxID=2066070 RepID=UPI003B5C4BE7